MKAEKVADIFQTHCACGKQPEWVEAAIRDRVIRVYDAPPRIEVKHNGYEATGQIVDWVIWDDDGLRVGRPPGINELY